MVNQNEIDAATLAVQKATNPQVKEFAQMMLKDHTSAGQNVTNITAQQGIVAADSMRSLELQATGARDLGILQTVDGEEFDRIYINQQVESHALLLKAIDAELLPSLQNDSFKSFFAELKPIVSRHLQMAKKLQSSLSSSSVKVKGLRPYVSYRR